jgi:hypothetical protein
MSRKHPGHEVASRREYESNGQFYRETIFQNGNKRIERIETLGERLRLIGTLSALLGSFAVLTTGWILVAHAILGSKLPLAALIPTHIVSAFIIAWAAILFGGFSESKRVAAAIILAGAPLATVLIVGVANFF